MSSNKVLVTTTSSLDGWEIETYLGPVFSHVVAGTGLFSDFAAGFSDVFGGRSQAYQRQLSAINSEVVELIKDKVSLLGGNLLLGLKVDHDEISGKAKQMFMVTASGTAARGVQKTTTRSDQKHAMALSADGIDVALRRKRLIEACKSIPLSISEDDWNFATENQLHEIAPHVLSSLHYALKIQPLQQKAYLDIHRKYLLALPPTDSVPALYGCLEGNALLFPFVRDTIFEGNLFDFNSLLSLLRSEQFNVRKWALVLAKAYKSYYTRDDIPKFETLIDAIVSTFTIRAQFIEEKSKLTSSIKQRWLCECGAKNNREQQNCGSCRKDVYGFLENDIKPDEALGFLKSELAILREVFQ